MEGFRRIQSLYRSGTVDASMMQLVTNSIFETVKLKSLPSPDDWKEWGKDSVDQLKGGLTPSGEADQGDTSFGP